MGCGDAQRNDKNRATGKHEAGQYMMNNSDTTDNQVMNDEAASGGSCRPVVRQLDHTQ